MDTIQKSAKRLGNILTMRMLQKINNNGGMFHILPKGTLVNLIGKQGIPNTFSRSIAVSSL